MFLVEPDHFKGSPWWCPSEEILPPIVVSPNSHSDPRGQDRGASIRRPVLSLWHKETTVRCKLCIDDSRDVREMLVEVLGNSGYSTLTAASGEEALRVLLRNKPVHLVILD